MFGWCLCQYYLSFYIWTTTELLYEYRSMFWIYGSFDIVTMIFCHSFCMLYHVWLCSCHPCDLTLLFSSLSLTIQPEKKIVKWSMMPLSRLSKVNQHLASHQLVLNQVYQKIRNIWQDINYNFTKSRRSKLVQIWFSVVRLHLVDFSVQVPTWWWSKYWRGLIVTKGLCIGSVTLLRLLGSNSY